MTRLNFEETKTIYSQRTAQKNDRYKEEEGSPANYKDVAWKKEISILEESLGKVHFMLLYDRVEEAKF
jgi:hypothetical protein